MNGDVVIRAFEARDRNAVRHICCETADCGKPMESFFHDRGFVTDLVTRYYTDFDSGSTWVAERNGQVVGYLTGCLDTRRQRRVTGWRIAPAALLAAIGRGVLAQRETWRMLVAMVKTLMRGGSRTAVPLDRFTAHVHINLLPAARGHHAGRRLMERFFEHAKQAGTPGVHAAVRADNESGCRFFERMGFVELSRAPMVLPVGDTEITTATVVYGKEL